jgi:hypothetical protein
MQHLTWTGPISSIRPVYGPVYGLFQHEVGVKTTPKTASLAAVFRVSFSGTHILVVITGRKLYRDIQNANGPPWYRHVKIRENTVQIMNLFYQNK